jgi:protein gp37
MSAIKNKGLKFFVPVLLLLIFFSCNQATEKKQVTDPNEITFIGLSNIGGSLGSYRIIKITKDSIHAEKGIAARKIHQQWHAEIDDNTWKKLVSTIDIKTLNTIKSSPSAQSVDGIDETFQIRTPKKSHVYVNSHVDTVHYRQLQNLKDQIQQILPKEYK